jgi:hypothetical protein
MPRESGSMVSTNLGVANRAHHNLNEDGPEPSEVMMILKNEPNARSIFR